MSGVQDEVQQFEYDVLLRVRAHGEGSVIVRASTIGKVLSVTAVDTDDPNQLSILIEEEVTGPNYGAQSA